MMEKFLALWDVLQKGREVADPVKWRGRQVTGNQVGGLILALVALAKFYDVKIPIDTEAALILGGGFAVLANTILTMVTCKHQGLGTCPIEPGIAKAGNQLPPAVPFPLPNPTQPTPPALYRVGEPHPSSSNTIIPNVDIAKPMQPKPEAPASDTNDPTKSLYFGD
jgi:hypothetical protein